jgi:hypothetical protein
MSEWISVKEKLPSMSQDVLIVLSMAGGETRLAHLVHYGDHQWFAGEYGAEYAIKDVNHWMPLPDPPKEET